MSVEDLDKTPSLGDRHEHPIVHHKSENCGEDETHQSKPQSELLLDSSPAAEAAPISHMPQDHHPTLNLNNFNLAEYLADLAHFIPSQGAIKDFIHHNTLHAFQNERFDTAVLRASRLFGARARLSPAELREFKKKGILSQDGQIYSDLAQLPIKDAKRPKGWVLHGMRVQGFAEHGVNIIQQTRAPLIRVLSNYLDQGIATHSNGKFVDFWEWLNYFFAGRPFNFKLFKSDYVQGALKVKPKEVIEAALKILVKDQNYYYRYLLEVLLGHPGWSGMVNQVDQNPQSLFNKKHISLEHLLALELALDVAVAQRIGGFRAFSGGDLPKHPSEISLIESSEERHLRHAHEALEWSFYLKKIKKIELNAKRPQTERLSHVQVFFCIDDRECSIRRHLESVDEHISTYGAAGFFGLDCKVQEAGYPYAVQSCPVVLNPRYLLKEEFIDSPSGLPSGKGPHLHHGYLSKSYINPIKGWLDTFVKGISISREIISQVFSPSIESNDRVTRLKVAYHGEQDGLSLGYTEEEMAERVFSVLRNVGFKQKMSKLVVIMAHESTSNNNPHYAAYDCGACSGRTGAQNARAFALMANNPRVREIIREQGIELPDDSWFIGAVHNTTRDEVRYFDLESVPNALLAQFEDFSRKFEKALELNAKERSYKFELFPRKGTPKEAHEHVKMRSVALFEPRPELNHATNAMCVVGRRQLTTGASFDRRSFLHSYDPLMDREGIVLTNILRAVVPVCGGINLEYYFSRMDNEVYGAGTKLPHNVVGLFGVSNGVIGDLRTGLPAQMIEVHDPLRLLIIVEQELDVALEAIRRDRGTFQWIENEWVHYACFNLSDSKIYRLRNLSWEKVIS